MFHIGDNSKLFVSISIGLLINNNTLLPDGDTLQYSTKVKDILPDWDIIDDYARDHLDLLDLLCEPDTYFTSILLGDDTEDVSDAQWNPSACPIHGVGSSLPHNVVLLANMSVDWTIPPR